MKNGFTQTSTIIVVPNPAAYVPIRSYLVEPDLPVSKERAQHIHRITRMALEKFRDENLIKST